MLFIGEQVGTGAPPHVDIAVDPIDGTRLLSLGMPNAIAVVAIAERGTMLASPDISYMNKIAVGAEAAGFVDIEAPVYENLRRVASAKGVAVNDLTVVVLDRPRHDDLIKDIRETGARIKMIPDGDVAGAVMAATPGTGIDVLLGIGGAPEAVVAACAIKCLGGEIQCVRYPRNEAERQIAIEQQISLDEVLRINDLVSSDNVFFAATGITDGELVRGVQFFSDGARTSSLVMRSRTGTIRRIDATHRLDKLRTLSGLQFD
jgi:fructose-1,6-bisphosphatase II